MYFKLIILILFLSSIQLFSQAGMKFGELVQRLDPYFDKDLIMDIKNQLPQGNDFSIWGWDVGDFSGDGFNDVAFSIRMAGDKKRTMQVYQFVDIDGFLRKVNQVPVEFVEMPLEVGVVIRTNICYITKKNKQFDWLMYGFTYNNGCIVKYDEFSTSRISDYTYEKYRNYSTLEGSERYLLTKNSAEKFIRKYFIIPSYSRGRLVYKGFENDVFTDKIDYVNSGAFYWSGDKDLSYKISSAHDEDFLYFTVDIFDDVVVGTKCDSCISDHIEMWFDVNSVNHDYDRFINSKNNKISFKSKIDTGIYKISIYPGDFYEHAPSVKVSTDDALTNFQKLSIRNIKAVSNLTENGYIVKFKIPFEFFGFDSNPTKDNKNIEIGCNSIVVDFDNEFRPEEETKLSISSFNPNNPTTYATLVMMPKGKWFGESENIFIDDVLKNLIEYGF